MKWWLKRPHTGQVGGSENFQWESPWLFHCSKLESQEKSMMLGPNNRFYMVVFGPQRAAARPRCQQAPRENGTHQGGTVPRGLCQPVDRHIRLSALCHVDLGSDSCASSASCRPRVGFLRLLCILAHRRTLKYFADMGDAEPGTDAFTLRRSQYLWRHNAAIGFGNAVAVARAHLAPPSSPIVISPPFSCLCRHPLPPSRPPPLHLVYIWLVNLPFVDGV